MSNHGPVPPSEQGKRRITYDVRIWKTRTLKGARGRSYQVRWTVAGKIHYATFATKALADSKEAQLKTAAREGEAFDIAAGLPLSAVSGGRDHEVSWYEFACAYTDMKWEEVAPNSRRAIADALATATPALLSTRRGAPKPEQLRKALYGWAFNTRLRATAPPPQLAAAATWAQRNTVALGDLGDPDTLRRVLNQLARKLDGTPAAATVVARKRAVLFNLLGYAVDKKHFAMNPMLSMRWTSPKAAEAIDRRRVVNARQAEALLEAVSAQGPMGRHLAGFFGAMYHAGLRPSEAVMLTLDELQIPDEEGKWGWLHLGSSAPSTGGAWNASGARRERRQLKHRAAKEVRPVPVSPTLAQLLRDHIAEHGTAPDGRLFRGEAGGLLSDTVYGRAWDKARHKALTKAEAASPLAERPYDLRHARLSTWLNAGVAPAQVAEWAGNSVPVLLRVYAKCLADSEKAALQRIEEAEAGA
ncbi:MAG TPA: tyrosine-type recombinase/integrase [Gemmataceae bacterium]|nr:tyrosine-type recombinase/integrase [Gemmataceae bacterium]